MSTPYRTASPPLPENDPLIPLRDLMRVVHYVPEWDHGEVEVRSLLNDPATWRWVSTASAAPLRGVWLTFLSNKGETR